MLKAFCPGCRARRERLLLAFRSIAVVAVTKRSLHTAGPGHPRIEGRSEKVFVLADLADGD